MLRIDVGDLDTEAGELLIEQMLRPAVDPAAGDQVVAGTQHGEMGQRGGAHTAGDEDRVVCSLEQGVFAGQRQLIGIVAVPAVEHFVFVAHRIDEGAALLYCGCNRRPIRPPVRNAVDCCGGDPELPLHAVGSGWYRSPLARTSRFEASWRSASRLRDSSHPRLRERSLTVSGPRSETQAKASRASIGTQPSSRTCPEPGGTATAASRWCVST